MKNYIRVLVACLALGANSPSYANFSMSPSGSTTAFAIDAANQGTSLCAAASTECPATVLINTAGAPIGVAAVPLQVSLANNGANATAVLVNQPTGTSLHAVLDTTSTTAVTQVTAANLNATVVGTGTFITQATLATETTKVIGTTRTVGNVGGVLDAIGQNVAAPANWLQTGCQFQTSPTTITATNGSPLQCNNAAQLLVSVANANANGQAIAANSSPVVAPVLTVAGAAVVKGGVPVVNGASTYQHVAASQTGAVLQTSTGATGDYLSHCVIYPVTTGAGSVTVFDNANAAATNVIEFATGTLSNLAPITVPVGAVSTAGAWKVTTGANETVVCYGKFS